MNAPLTHGLRSHHAYLLEGAFDIVRSPLARRVEEDLGVNARGNPDFSVLEYALFGIDEARELAERASRRPVAGDRQVLVIGALSLTREAQNALLKLFEEPGEGTHFFLIVPSAESLLPTLRSRLAVLDAGEFGVGAAQNGASGADALSPEQFLSSSSVERLAMVKSLIVTKDAPGAARFLENLERVLRARSGALIARDDVFLFESLARCRSYLRDRSPSVKMILEYIAAVLPRTGNTRELKQKDNI